VVRPLRHHHWQGTHQEIGRQHGESERPAIADFCEFALGSPSPWNASDRGKSGPLLEKAEHLLAASRLYDPHLAAELLGIAEGSNQPIDRIALINAFLDLLPFAAAAGDNGNVGCTTLGLSPSDDGRTPVLMGQNYDVWGALRPLAITAQIEPSDCPIALVFTFAGVLGCAGLNNHGLGLTINYLDAGRSGVGVLYPVIVRRALAQSRVGDALGSIVLPSRGCSVHYMVGSSDGVLIGLETTPDGFARLVDSEGFLAHSNHFLSDQLVAEDAMMHTAAFDTRVARPGSSIVRHYVAERLLRQGRGEADRAQLQAVLTDHVNFPYSICFHGDETLPVVERSQTVASMVLDLQARAMWVSDGSHHGPYREVVLDSG
jgi:isopenicillin-N N-acyltransferase like protein